MADFLTSFNKTLSFEGGYVDDPDDTGGQTYKGISRENNPNWTGWAFIDGARNNPNFPKCLDSDMKLQELVHIFYKTVFWDKISLDHIVSQSICDELFDSSVNMGLPFESKTLQTACWLLGCDIDIDGVIGEKTIAAANSCNVNQLLLTLNILQGERYKDICIAKPSQRKFFKGWLKRVALSF